MIRNQATSRSLNHLHFPPKIGDPGGASGNPESVAEELFMQKAQDASTAKTFLVNRVIEQAVEDGIPLSEVEKGMLTFSEVGATPTEMNVANAFSEKYDSDKFEAKIAKLIGRAYRRDKRLGSLELWRRSLAALSEDDCYLLVMVEQARIKIPGRGRTLAIILLDKWTILGAVVGLLGFVFLIPLRGIGEPLAGNLIHTDLMKGLLLILWLATLWGIGHMSRPK